ncbi:MAG: outer membrane lipoprotein carrier protein LolA [Bacteroides sp.]|jgi:outer membrane lipoprotein-sorting protein|nr:outer membrane lipoprotein carrier protein LolA [Bacteroides sp.]
MKKYIASAILVFLFLVPGFGQSEPDRAAEVKGTEMLQQASAKLKTYRSMKIQFTYEMGHGEQVIEAMKGELISQGDRYRMEVDDNLFISDGINTWSYLDEMEEVYVNLLENNEGGLTPTSILEEFETQFRAKHIRQESHQGKQVEIIDLVPKTPQAFFKFRVALDPSTKMLVYTIAYDREGGTYTYRIDRFEGNPEVADSLFTFNASDYPDAEVIDLR